MIFDKLDKGAALEIMRYTVKTAAAPSVGGQAGAPAPDPGPLNPTGGATQGGSNNPQMQTGWAAGNMRKSLIKRFTANASKKMMQNVNTAAGRQNAVGGMGSGLPKMASIGKQLEKSASVIKEANPALGLLRLIGLGGKAARGGKAVGALSRGTASVTGKASKLINPRTMRPFGEAAKKPLQLVDHLGRPMQAASRVKPGLGSRIKETAGRVRASLRPRVQQAREATQQAVRNERARAQSLRAGSNWVEPAAREGAGRLGRLKHWAAHRGTGLRNVYRNKETGQLVTGGRGYFRRPPDGFEKFKGFGETGGYLNRAAKKTLANTGYAGAGLYGGSFIANPGGWKNAKGEVTAKSVWKNLTRPERLEMAKAAPMLGVGSTIPGFAYTVADQIKGGPLSRQMHKSTANAISLARQPGGITHKHKNTRQGADSWSGIMKNMGGDLDSPHKRNWINKIKDTAKKNKAKKLKKIDTKIDADQGASLMPKTKLDRALASTRGSLRKSTSRPVQTGFGPSGTTGEALVRASAKKPKAPTYTDKTVAQLDPSTGGRSIFRMPKAPTTPQASKAQQVGKLRRERAKLIRGMRQGQGAIA